MTFRKSDIHIDTTFTSTPSASELKFFQVSPPRQPKTKPIRHSQAIDIVVKSVPDLLPPKERFSQQSSTLSAQRMMSKSQTYGQGTYPSYPKQSIEPTDRIDRLPDPPPNVPWQPTQPPYPEKKSPSTSALSSTTLASPATPRTKTTTSPSRKDSGILRTTVVTPASPKGKTIASPKSPPVATMIHTKVSIQPPFSPTSVSAPISSMTMTESEGFSPRIFHSLSQRNDKSPRKTTFQLNEPSTSLTIQTDEEIEGTGELPWYMYKLDDIVEGKHDKLLLKPRNDSVSTVHATCKQLIEVIPILDETIRNKQDNIEKLREKVKKMVKLDIKLENDLNGFQKCLSLVESISKDEIKRAKKTISHKKYVEGIRNNHMMKQEQQQRQIREITSSINRSNDEKEEAEAEQQEQEQVEQQREAILVEDVFPTEDDDKKKPDSRLMERIKLFHEKRKERLKKLEEDKMAIDKQVKDEQIKREQIRKRYNKLQKAKSIHNAMDTIISDSDSSPMASKDLDTEEMVNLIMLASS